MSVVAHVTVPAERFALGEVLEVGADVEVRLEAMIPTGDARVPYFWVETDHADAISAALRPSPIVEEVRIVDEADGENLFRVEWSSEVNGVLSAIEDTEGVILEGTGNGDRWSFQLRFPDHTGLSAFYQTCIERGIPVELKGIHGLSGTGRGTESRLTAEQKDALRIAFERGYFAVPRRITLVELADELGISDTATSQRLRRGLNSLLSTALGTEMIDEG